MKLAPKYIYGLMVLGVIGISIFYLTPQTLFKTQTTETPVVELHDKDTYTLTAENVTHVINGKPQNMVAYNGSIPGPTIKVPQGATVTIHFVNKLSEPTLLHSHGVRMQNAFDGSNLVQKEIKPGESFDYVLTFPDVGIFWYHPHTHEASQQNKGLYGNFVVTPKDTSSKDASYWAPANIEHALMLSDLLVQKDGIIADHHEPSHFALMGRFGNTMLINGKTNYTLSVHKGDVVRLYLTNAANTRVYNVAIPGATLKLVGSDNGRVQQERFVESVTISPSERVVVDAYLPNAGTLAIENQTPAGRTTLGTIVVSADTAVPSYQKEFAVLRTNTDIANALPNLASYYGKAPDKTISFTMSMGTSSAHGHGMNAGMMQSGSHVMPDGTVMSNSTGVPAKIEWEDTMAMMNEMSTTDAVHWQIVDKGTGAINHDINWHFKKGDLVKIRVVNDASSMHPMQHPFHMHGQRFIVLATNGVKNTDLSWKDTTLVQTGDTVDILVPMDNPGAWMAHCHIAEHLESGMMFNFYVD